MRNPSTTLARAVAQATLAATLSAVLALATPGSSRAQVLRDSRVPDSTSTFSLAGPRFGVSILTGAMRSKLADRGINVGPVISQFGWQLERQFLSSPGGLTAVTEWIFLVGGLDQGAFLPSMNWLVGVRTPNGTEFGIGPNVSPAGFALVVAAGVTYRSGALNIPVNVALVPSKEGVRVGLMTGFTMR